ncbi:MAG TPA: hypothetical protein ENK44_10320 [Caldithrix abyssi]|uniref:DUF560 domain-containing protein n=1 Tax=Caldithrix abyssi TaxID=187145 RepID=A0A7V4WV74_CALAY|nr:hypothetical protein [Caldithrix abyssi]
MTYFRIFALLLFSWHFVQAQFTSSLDVSTWYDDNVYRSPEPEQDILQDISIGLNYTPDKSAMNYFYNGSFLLYRNANTRNFSLHSFGLSYNKSFGNEDQNDFYFGGNWTMRLNGDDYNYYDYNQLYLYANFRFDLDWAFLRAGYNYRYRGYTNIPDLTNYRHYLFVQANKSFETRTTIILETDLGYKSFAGQETISGSSGGGHGRGRMSDYYSEYSATEYNEIPSLSQVVLLARVSQSVTDKVGIYVQYRTQLSPTKQTSFVNAGDYFQDEELFDDPFSYEAQSYSSQLTWVLPWSARLQIGGVMENKQYISEQAFTSAEDTVGLGGNRVDDRQSYFINLSKTLRIDKKWMESLHFYLNYNYIWNRSNSYWYDYKNAVIGAGVNWSF